MSAHIHIQIYFPVATACLRLQFGRVGLLKIVCSLKLFFKKLIMGFCRYDHSEQLFPLELLLKMRSYSSGNRRIFGKMSGIFVPFSKDFLRFSKIGLYLTPKNAISCHIRQKIEKMARQGLQKVRKGNRNRKKKTNKIEIEK